MRWRMTLAGLPSCLTDGEIDPPSKAARCYSSIILLRAFPFPNSNKLQKAPRHPPKAKRPLLNSEG